MPESPAYYHHEQTRNVSQNSSTSTSTATSCRNDQTSRKSRTSAGNESQ